MRPNSIDKARNQMRQCMLANLTRLNAKEKNKRIEWYIAIAEVFYKEMGIGIYQLKLRHCQWYLGSFLRHHVPATRYKHWLRLKEIMEAIGRYDDWEPRLRGPWRNPNGSQYIKNNRGRKPKVNIDMVNKRCAARWQQNKN